MYKIHGMIPNDNKVSDLLNLYLKTEKLLVKRIIVNYDLKNK